MQFAGDHLGCPTGWDGWKDWCYYTPRKASVANYADAEERCQFYGGELVSIHDQAEQSFVTYLQAYASKLFFLVNLHACSFYTDQIISSQKNALQFPATRPWSSFCCQIVF